MLNLRVVGPNVDRILVFGHGFGSDQSVWDGILPYFLHDYKIVMFDLPCANTVRSGHFSRNRHVNIEAYVDDLITLLDHLRIEECIYVGHSMSGVIGMLASIRRPELFTKLIFIGFTPCMRNEDGYRGGFERRDLVMAGSAMMANYGAWVNGYAPQLVGPVGEDVPGAVIEFTRTLFNMRPNLALFVAEMLFNMDVRGYLQDVSVPCAIIQTANDSSVPMEVATYTANNLGGPCTLHFVDVQGHLPHLSAPFTLAQLLRQVLPC